MSLNKTYKYVLSEEDSQIIAWLLTGLKHETIRLAKKQRRLGDRELLILNGPASNFDGDESIQLLDTVADETYTTMHVEADLIVRELLSVLKPQQAQVLSAILLQGMTEKETAKKMGISQQAVSKIKKKALTALKEYLISEAAENRLTSLGQKS